MHGPATEAMPALLLPVGEEWHAVALPSVREVLAVPAVAPLPATPAWLAGLVNVRGEILPAVDTGQALGGGATAGTHLVVVDTTSGPVAVLVTGTPDAGVLGDRRGDGVAVGSAGHYGVEDGRIVTLLQLDALVGAAR